MEDDSAHTLFRSRSPQQLPAHFVLLIILNVCHSNRYHDATATLSQETTIVLVVLAHHHHHSHNHTFVTSGSFPLISLTA